jgi:hypothetical protein
MASERYGLGICLNKGLKIGVGVTSFSEEGLFFEANIAICIPKYKISIKIIPNITKGSIFFTN